MWRGTHSITHDSFAYSVCVWVWLYAVRQKAKDILSFLADDERLREARKAARKTRDKYVGYSSDDMQNRYSKLTL